jgi:tetratricopeptide (TPR) repeat protein
MLQVESKLDPAGTTNHPFLETMTNDKLCLQIRNGIYVLCLISAITLKWLSAPASLEQELINELNGLLEANQLDQLTARCNEILVAKPLSRTGHYYLGLAYYHSGDATNCRKHLQEALRIDPTWNAAIEPYLQKLEEAQHQDGAIKPAIRTE